MNLTKTSILVSISTFIGYISGFITTKVVALNAGPEGIALLGGYQNMSTLLTMFASGATVNGIVKYLSQYSTDRQWQQRIITTGINILTLGSLLISAIVLAGYHYFSVKIFHDSSYQIAFVFLGIFMPLSAFNNFFSGYLNGVKRIGSLVFVNIFGALSAIVIVLLAAQYFGIKGVLISTNITALVIFITNLFIHKKKPGGLSMLPSLGKWDKEAVRKLFSFSLMTIVMTLAVPYIQILIRDRIITQFSPTDAGYWQSVIKISDYYINFITIVLNVYYIPKLSELKTKQELKHEIFKGYKLVMPAVCIIALLIWVFRFEIVNILYSNKFGGTDPLFKFQLISDVFRIGGWMLDCLMWAKALTRTFIITKLLFSVFQVLLSYYFLDHYGVIGATYAFCIAYFVYWAVMAFILRRHLF